jgi:uncharacterized protein YjbJ (UPF0337 family)
MREDLQKVFETAKKSGLNGDKLKILLESLRRVEENPNIKVVTGNSDTVFGKIKEEFDSMIGKCIGDLLKPYDIPTEDQEIMHARLVLENLELEINLNNPNCSIFLLKRKEREFVSGFYITLEVSRTPLNTSSEMGKMALKISSVDLEGYELYKTKKQMEESHETEVVADLMVGLFGANKQKVIDVINSTEIEGDECDCLKCKIKKAVDNEFDRYSEILDKLKDSLGI